MNAIFDYICDEIEEIEQKIQKDGKLSMTEIDYLDTLEHIKKDILTSEAMMDGGYSNDGSYDNYGNGGMNGGSYNSYRGYSGRRGRDSMGRYTSGRRYSRDEAKDEVMRHLEKAMTGASGEQRKIIQDALEELKNM